MRMRRSWLSLGLLAVFGVGLASAQTPPIAIVSVEGVQLTGAMDVAEGKAMIATNGTITAGDRTATVTLPHRGSLRLCATTKVSLTSDTSIASTLLSGEAPGLMMALDRGALEAGFATGKNSDVILTPDFRITISGPGTASVDVRLGAKGDTCIENRGPNAPYVAVSGIFDGGLYRVQQDQRVMFEHGSLNEVVDNEKESCGCPPDTPATLSTSQNAFPLAQSEGLAPLPTPPPNASQKGVVSAQATVQLGYDGTKPEEAKAAAETHAVVQGVPVPTSAPVIAPKPDAKPGFFTKLGHFFRKLFGG